MKVTPALKKEMAQWLDTYWTTYLKGDIETWSTFISDDYRNIGGTKEEIWNSKQEIIDYTNSILDQMIGTVDIRNRQVELFPYGEFLMVNEFTDLYIKIEGDWIFYGPFRMSSLLKKTNSGWIALHQHGSYPDMKAMEGEAFSIDALKAENVKLQAAVKSRTLQLEHNNRELEIEAAIERVRSRSMAMHKSEELKEVIQVVYHQFIQLNINIEHTGFIIDYREREDMHIWLADRYASPFEISIPYFDSPHWNSFLAAKQKGEHFFSNLLPFEVKNKFYRDLFKLIPTLPEEAQEAIFSKPGLAISTVLLDNVGLYIENFDGTPFTDEENNTLLRFGKVFQQTYTRFLDLKKAEAQARQAESDLMAIKEAKQKAEDTLRELQVTQKQLIQAEKTASLGELTAGIAHEIQNPLNFVNNFSEVSNELLDEMNAELNKGNYDDAKEIAADVKQNLEKINHHGKRADAIVKGMLLHSRRNNAVKEPTDINALCDEYLRLSYHGLRAKDKSFNATFKTDFDNSIQKINVVPQDLGRVILNLINNAFYAVNERKKLNEAGYEPTVIVSTSEIDNSVEIKVKDNGKGIPKNIVDKIFQPFFTTKPTGQGTGLGLSLSYDIVKAHGAGLKVQTKEGEGTVFTIVFKANL